MGLHIQSLYEIPVEAHRKYFIYLLDYGWHEPLGKILMKNYERIASIASENDAVVIRGTDRVHFEDQVLSWHHINGQQADNLLPAILITNRNPHRFKESGPNTKHPPLEIDLKLILIPLKKFCSNSSDVLPLLQRLLADVKEGRELNDFRVIQQMHKGKERALADAIVLSPGPQGREFGTATNFASYLFTDNSKYSVFLTNSDWRNKLVEILAHLYDEGPEQDNVWKRAGGSVSIFKNSANRKSQWFEALDKLSKGGGGKNISIDSLINVIKEDYGKNEQLENLLEISQLNKEESKKNSTQAESLIQLNNSNIDLSEIEVNEIREELKKEIIKLKFSEGTELLSLNVTSVLNGYYQDLLKKKLIGFRFESRQIIIENDATYEKLKDQLQHSPSVDLRRLVSKLEQFLIEGTRIILDYAYLKDKQIHNTYQSLFWFTRAIRNWIIWCFRKNLSDHELDEIKYGEKVLESPLLGFRDNIEEFYGGEVIKIDLWHPEIQDAPKTSVFLRRNGYAGSWFSQYPQLAGPFIEHYSPNDFYNFILPQMVMRHLINGESIIEDWNGYYIGCA